MLNEPRLGCPQGHGTCTLNAAAAHGMRCPVCAADLVPPPPDDWLQFPPSQNSENEDAAVLAELVLPAHNPVDAAAVTQFFASLPVPVSLILYGAGDRRALLVRGGPGVLRQMAGKLQALWPAARLQPLGFDPRREITRQEQHAFGFRLDKPDYFPLRIWDTFARGDPVASLLSALQGLASQERLWLQLRLECRGTPAWLAPVQQRLKLELQRGLTIPEPADSAHQLPVQPQPRFRAGSALDGLLYLAVLLAAVGVMLLAVSGRWLAALAGLVLSCLIALGVLRLLPRRMDPWQAADLTLIRDKLIQREQWLQSSLGGLVWASGPERARELAGQLEQAMGQYAVSGGNRFCLVALDDSSAAAGPPLWLSPGELAGLWHPPLVEQQLSPGQLALEGAARRAPDPQDVTGFYPIGSYFTAAGESRPVCISASAMQHNLFCIGKPGTGKSTLMLHLCLAALQDAEQPALIVIDPHGDLAEQLIGALPDAALDRVRLLEVGDPEYCLTYNPLDVHRSGWGVEAVTNAVVDIGRALWSDYWGPRMQIPLKRGVQLLAAANDRRPADACLGLSQLATLLNADPELRQAFLMTELEDSPYLEPLGRYFRRDFDSLSRSFREQIIQPVLSKAYRFEEEPMLTLFSCPQSQLDLQEIFHERRVLVINTGKNRYGSEISDFVGSLLINAALMELLRQGARRPDARVPVALVVDEFQTFCGVDWAELLQQMRKYGGRLVLGTQSLSSLRQQDAALPDIILSGVYSLFAFLVNGEDAAYLARLELSQERGGPDADTLISLEPFRAYVRLERPDGRMARPFYFASREPPPFEAARAAQVRRLRARYSLAHSEALRQAQQMLSAIGRYGHLQGSPPPQKTPAGVASAAQVLLAAGRDDPGVAVALPWTADPPPAAPQAGSLLAPSEWESFLNAYDHEGPDTGVEEDDADPQV